MSRTPPKRTPQKRRPRRGAAQKHTPPKVTGRAIAAKVLDELERRDGWAETLLSEELARAKDLDHRERGLATELVYGTLRRRARLDAYIEAGAKRPLKKLDPRVVTLLRVGAYQLLHLDRIPPSAAVNEAVKLARGSGLAKASGLVNAVLRSISDGRVSLTQPEDEAERLALELSAPLWLTTKWLSEYGTEGARQMALAANATPPILLRVLDEDKRDEVADELNRHLEQVGGSAGPGAYSPCAVWVSGGGDPRALPPVREGRALVQGQASQLIPLILAPEKGARVLDLCSAPGLKATHLSSLAGTGGSVTAVELHPHRAKEVEELAGNLGLNNVKVVCTDARSFDDAQPFDAVLVDAPCSGLGILAHAPERKWRIEPGKSDELAKLQGELLDKAAGLLKPGGALLYSTCTTARDENEAVVEGFLGRHKDFSPEEPPGALELGELIDAAGHLKTYPLPLRDDPGYHLDGFFAAKMRRKG